MTKNQFKIKNPTTIIIFGVTGDLAQRKLIPALHDLYVRKLLPADFQIVGFSRRDWDQRRFRQFIHGVILRKKHQHKKAEVERFLNHLVYSQGTFDSGESYLRLGRVLVAADKKFGICSNKLFYLAVPPKFYSTIFTQLSRSGLTIPCIGKNEGWTRVLVEKPFGRDLKTAQALDKKLGKLFSEDQIFRIDHYLAKETIQNILMFRFSNMLFEPIWNRDHVEKVEIKFLETIGVEGRGGFYDDIGALRDVGQNHMLQMLAAIAMEDPGEMLSSRIRKQRVKILQDLKPIRGKEIARKTIRGQYQGFTKEKEVLGHSKTETYFKLEAQLKNRRWAGVPFYLESGKKMGHACNEIKVYFKPTESCLCLPGQNQHYQNILSFRISPDEGIAILFWAKKPGFTAELESKELAFKYQDGRPDLNISNAYEQVLFDCIQGERTRFLSTGEVDASWRFITPILKNWHKTKLYIYKKGSLGPDVKNNLT